MADHQIVDANDWRSARIAHLADEKSFTRARDALAQSRRELPWLEIVADYELTGETGAVPFLDLFGDAEQLVIYHFMFGPDWDEGCPSCSFWAEGFSGMVPHLRHRNTAFAVVARAPWATLDTYRSRMGWTFPWYSSLGSPFNFDLGVSYTQEQVESGDLLYNFGTQTAMAEEPGISTFRRDGDRIFLTYQTFSRGLDMLNGTYQHLDLTSLGRDEDELPWTMAWLHRSDAYPD